MPNHRLAYAVLSFGISQTTGGHNGHFPACFFLLSSLVGTAVGTRHDIGGKVTVFITCRHGGGDKDEVFHMLDVNLYKNVSRTRVTFDADLHGFLVMMGADWLRQGNGRQETRSPKPLSPASS